MTSIPCCACIWSKSFTSLGENLHCMWILMFPIQLMMSHVALQRELNEVDRAVREAAPFSSRDSQRIATHVMYPVSWSRRASNILYLNSSTMTWFNACGHRCSASQCPAPTGSTATRRSREACAAPREGPAEASGSRANAGANAGAGRREAVCGAPPGHCRGPGSSGERRRPAPARFGNHSRALAAPAPCAALVRC